MKINCIYCWRPTEFYDTLEMPADLVDEPDMMINNLLQERRRLIVGHYGNIKTDKMKLDESLFPQHYAISLSGRTYNVSKTTRSNQIS